MKVNDFPGGPKVDSYVKETKPAPEETKAKEKAAPPAGETPEDTVELSERSREVLRAQEVVRTAPAVRQDKVAAVKARLESGKYQVKNKEVAEKVLREALDELV